jgi:hypothetical protein
MRRSKQRADQVTARLPHPDPGMEVRLQQILSLQATARRRDRAAEEARVESGLCRAKAGNCSRNGYSSDAAIANSQADLQDSLAVKHEKALAETHAEIVRLASTLNESDLAWLYPLSPSMPR